MRLLLKFPTRSRPQQAMMTLQAYINMATNPNKIGIAMSCDTDDDSMTRTLVQDEFARILGGVGWHHIYYGNSKSKIEACNADMDAIDYPWDIVMLVSDDMIPIVKGYDDAIRSHMMAAFPDTNGILWFNDGHQGKCLNTLSIMGRKMYESIGYIYNPSYKSFYCDTEFTDMCNTSLKSKCFYIPSCIIRHEHPGHGYGGFDSLYAKNQTAWVADLNMYISRKTYPNDWTILIPTIPGRERKLQALIEKLHSLHKNVCPYIKLVITIGYDKREASIGAKRHAMLQATEGKYVSFVDDDDDVTPAYFEDAAAMIAGNFDCMRLRGQIKQWTFTHSLSVKMTDPMANATTFLRPPNHLNPMKADIAKTIKYCDITNGEDFDWTVKMARMGYLSTEYQSAEDRIHYIYDLGDRALSPNAIVEQMAITHEQMVARKLAALMPRPQVQPQVQEPQFKLGPRGFVRT